METFRRLIVPVDGSPASTCGVAYALQLARTEGATVDVCSVIDDATMMVPIAAEAFVDPRPLIAALEERSTAFMETALTQLRSAGVTASATTLHGRPITEIDELARRTDADAIVIGTNGRGGMERAFLGSLTTALLYVADIPVVVVHADDRTMLGPILVAVDATSPSSAALACAIARARASRTTLLLLHVFEESQIDRLSATLGLRPASARQRALNDAESALDELADQVREAGIPFRTDIVRGPAAETIVSTARAQHARAIAIGTHGRGELERLFIGSVADVVVRTSDVPVYVVRRARTHKARAFMPIAEPAQLA